MPEFDTILYEVPAPRPRLLCRSHNQEVFGMPIDPTSTSETLGDEADFTVRSSASERQDVVG